MLLDLYFICVKKQFQILTEALNGFMWILVTVFPAQLLSDKMLAVNVSANHSVTGYVMQNVWYHNHNNFYTLTFHIGSPSYGGGVKQESCQASDHCSILHLNMYLYIFKKKSWFLS